MAARAQEINRQQINNNYHADLVPRLVHKCVILCNTYIALQPLKWNVFEIFQKVGNPLVSLLLTGSSSQGDYS